MDYDEARPGTRAGEEARSLPIDQIVTRLRAILGARLVAYIGHVDTTTAVRAWADADDVPDADNDTRLRTAFHALAILVEGSCDEVTIGTWFQGMNPVLGDVSPARFIRNSVPDGANDVLVAAWALLVD
jgi:hypothetical protein